MEDTVPSIATPSNPSTSNRSPEPRCPQCGDRIRTRPTTRERELCADCAYDTVPCTD